MSSTKNVTIRLTVGITMLLAGFGQQADLPARDGDVPQPQSASEVSGIWYLDSTATSTLWPESKSAASAKIEFKGSGAAAALTSPDGESLLSLAYWSSRDVTVAEFGAPKNSEGNKKSIQVTVIGIGGGARLFATVSVGDSSASCHAYSRRDPKATKAASSLSGYWTKVEDVTGDIVELTNGGIVEVSGYVGYVGYGKRAFLRPASGKLWIEGKKDYRVTVLKDPSLARKSTYQEKTISRAADDGSLFIFLDGSIFDPFFPTFVGAFSEYQSCMILDGTSMLFDDGDLIESGMLR